MSKPTKREFEEFKKEYDNWYKQVIPEDFHAWTSERRMIYLRAMRAIAIRVNNHHASKSAFEPLPKEPL